MPSRPPPRCRLQVHVRTGAPDDAPIHLPCDEAQIRAELWCASAKDLAAKWGVAQRTVARWRQRFRPPEPRPLGRRETHTLLWEVRACFGVTDDPDVVAETLAEMGYRFSRLP